MTSRPLPIVEVRHLSADRGADDVRAHLDSAPCALCGCPDAPLASVEIPWTGKWARRRVCRGHSEHPDHPGTVQRENPTDYRYCARCGDLSYIRARNGLCDDCRMGFDTDELHAYLDSARRMA
jgi:hypothetical protein